MTGPLARYQALVASGDLDADPAQASAAARLEALHDALESWKPKGLFGIRNDPPKGLYLWGGVGRGKSLLMDLFFETATVEPKRRVHFHAFMQEVHARIKEWRGLSQVERRKRPNHVRGAGDDPIRPTARAIAQSARLLCFDEFQVTDIADATILGRLAEALLDEGVVMVATSNRHPDDLYKNGLNRQLFLPFIEILKARFEIHELDAARDYRLERLAAAPVWLAPLGPDAASALDKSWRSLTFGCETHSCPLEVQGRTIVAPLVACNAARFTFEELCARPLGPADYLAIASAFQTIFLEGVPQLGPEKRNEAKRFVTLIDALYEARTKLVASAAVEDPTRLYVAGDGAFEFARTASRLMEMRSADYLAEAHRPEGALHGAPEPAPAD